jgi:hypothetical protein
MELTMARRERPSNDPRRWVDEHGHEIEESDRGLVYDLQTLVDRRKVLGLFGGLSAATLLAACGGSGTNGSASTGTTGSSAGGDFTEVPEETAGPYPGDGSNGPNVLDDSGIVCSDIRSSFGSSTTAAEGVPLEIRLTVRDAATGDAAKGAGVYLWQSDRDGNYSLYSQAAANENYLRGAQEADANGTVTWSGPDRQDLPDRPAQGGLRGRLRHLRLRAERLQPVPGQPGRRHGLRRRRRHPPARHHVRRRLRRLHRHPDHRGLTPRPR